MLVNGAGSRAHPAAWIPNPLGCPFGSLTAFQPHQRSHFPRAFADSPWEIPELPLGWPKGKLMLQGPCDHRGFSQCPLLPLSFCPFSQHPSMSPGSHTVGTTCPVPPSPGTAELQTHTRMLQDSPGEHSSPAQGAQSSPSAALLKTHKHCHGFGIFPSLCSGAGSLQDR